MFKKLFAVAALALALGACGSTYWDSHPGGDHGTPSEVCRRHQNNWGAFSHEECWRLGPRSDRGDAQ